MIERIRRRLTLMYVGILALILILVGAIVVIVFSHQLTAQQDEQLAQQARGAANFVQDHGPGGPEERRPRGPDGPNPDNQSPKDEGGPGPEIGVYSVPPQGVSANQGVIYGKTPGPNSSDSLGLPFTKVAEKAGQQDKTIIRTLSGPEGEVRVLSLPVTNKSGEMIAVVQAAQSRHMVQETVSSLVLILIPVGLGALLLAGAGGLFMSRRAMQPVNDSFQRQRTFIADASHELKTPLALVKIGAEVIKRNPTDSGNEEIVDDQLSEIDRMNALLSDLLVLARLDAGRLAVEDKPFDLSVIAAETAGRFLVRAGAEGVHLEVEVPERLPARGDPEKVGQVLGVLLDNAMRYTPKGGTVTVSGRQLDNRVEASVSDTGPGIPAEHLENIFDRFYRVEEARTRAGGGTSLGLSIARDLTQAQGGEIFAENAPGKGAVLRMRLPGP